jgi:hypothetical protein
MCSQSKFKKHHLVCANYFRVKIISNLLTAVLCNILIFYTENLHAVADCYPEDLEFSRQTLLISGIKDPNIVKEVADGKKAVITVCTTPLTSLFCGYVKDLKHVLLVFETKDRRTKSEINVSAVHFGANDDGCSLINANGRPTVYNARETLQKVYRGKETSYFDSTSNMIIIFLVDIITVVLI